MTSITAESELETGELQSDAVVSNRYCVESSLGQGGAASVYRVREVQSGRRVALKRLRLGGGKQDALLTSQFEREYHTLSELAHPSIIEVYDYGVDRGCPYYTMELLDGEDLSERGRLPFREVCTLLCDVASSLAIVHSRNRVHRDVSARNVRCTRAVRAKLLDFGAMAAMGKSHPLVGTPPFVPPEAVQLQPLDARVDLYALGALAYFMLTGRHAYPAQTFSQLRDRWRSAPATPRQYDASVPETLDRLVMELLQLERAARPRSAAEVMERFAGIAGLPLQELPAVQHAYLAVPMLVGREAELSQLRRSLVNALQGRGGSVLIEGARGVGRTRLLDAGVLEAKLMGAVVLRADASGGVQREEYALARTLCGQLLTALPVLAEQSAGPRRALLAHVMPELAAREGPGSPPPRRQLQAALRDFCLSVAREQLIVIAVDEITAADEASAALLGMLAHGATRRRLCLLLSAAPEAEPSQVLALLGQVASPIALGPLQQRETAALVKSLFGDVEHVAQLAERIHNLSEGNPRWVMLLCERLASRGIARYHAGRWTLPHELDADVVPSSLSAELAARIEALPALARELAQILSLSDPAAFALPDYIALCPHVDHGRTYRALEALVASGVLLPARDRYQFSQQEFVRLLRAAVSPELGRALHERLASALAGGQNSALLAHHLLLAGRAGEALDVIMSQPEDVSSWERAAGELLERTLTGALAQARDLSVRRRLDATLRLFTRQMLIGRREAMRDVSPLLQRVQQDSGLCDYAESSAGTPRERMERALERATSRYNQTPVAERVFSPAEAVEILAWISGCVATLAAIGQDLELLERIPPLEPLAELFPIAGIAQRELEVCRAMQSGRSGRAFQQSMALLERMRTRDGAGLKPAYAQALRLGQLYIQGLVRASIGIDVPAELLAELEQVAGYRAHAWRVRMTAALVRADFEAGAACERRAMLISLQDGAVFPGTTARVELLAHIAADNLTGIGSILERTAVLAEQHPGWRATHAIARAHHLRLQGDLEGALAALQPALQLTGPGRHIDWTLGVQTRLELLTRLGRSEEAVECGRHAGDQASVAGVPLPASFRVAQGIAALEVGDVDAARQLIDGAVTQLGSIGAHGLLVGSAYEARARVAIAMRDIAALHDAMERCAEEFKLGDNAVLNARYERLLREANRAGLELPASAEWRAGATAPGGDEVEKTVYSRMLTCIGPVERAREVLRLLLDASGAQSGYLFGPRSGKLELLANVDESETPPELVVTLEAYLRDELEAQERSREVLSPRPVAPLQPWIDAWGREFEPWLLAGEHEGEVVIAGIAALHHEGDERPALSRALLQALTAALIAEDIIDPVTCAG